MQVLPPVHSAMTFLLDHLPRRMHLVIASRADPPLPLARLRARGDLTELRVADLRFTADEASAFSTSAGCVINIVVAEWIIRERTDALPPVSGPGSAPVRSGSAAH